MTEVWLAWRDGVDDLVGFETEARRDAYAAAVPGVHVGVLEVLNDSAAGQFIIDAAAEAAEEAAADCDCYREVVPGAWTGFNGRNEVQACGDCERFWSDQDAAEAVAAAVGGRIEIRVDLAAETARTWWVVTRDGEELTADRIRELAAARAATA